ncbi:MAG: protein kinase, partial [Proteobacteria bacterium]|nr:protein kinase [Pseudomonadota bacterium]
MNLPKGFLLVDRFTVQERLGSGSFGVVYKVFDDLGNVERVIKLITKDRLSTYERLRREYTALTALDGHDNVVKVIWAGRLPDSTHTPYIAFEYVKGRDVSAMIESGELSSDDTFRIMCDAAMGLAYIHENGVYHQDIKPSNLVWTDHGVIIIDFNVAVTEGNEVQINSGTRRYLPPDFDYAATEPNPIVRADRDLYALGITLYECLTGLHPLDNPEPPPDAQTTELKQFQSREDLKAALEIVVAQMTAPERKDRYASADELLSTIDELKYLRSTPPAAKIVASPKPVASTTNASPTSAGNDAAAVATSTHDGNESDIGVTITAGPDPQAEAIAQAAANNAITSSAPAGTETAAGIGPTTQANETAHPTTPHAGESTPAPHAGEATATREAAAATRAGETTATRETTATPHASETTATPHAGEAAATPHAGEATTTPHAGETAPTRDAPTATPAGDAAAPHAAEAAAPPADTATAA